MSAQRSSQAQPIPNNPNPIPTPNQPTIPTPNQPTNPTPAPAAVPTTTSNTTLIHRDPNGKELSRATFHEEPNTIGAHRGYGYLPITLGSTIHEGKLEIVRKLGWGRTASVWLARVRNNAYPVRYVAVKVLTAYSTYENFVGQSRESHMLELVKTHSSTGNNNGSKHCLRLFETFQETSPHGEHLCIVMEMLGGDLYGLRNALNLSVPLALVKRIVKQELEAVGFLHKMCGIVHTNLIPQNVLVAVPNMDAVIDQTLRDDPSATYPPREEDASNESELEPILTVKSQPLAFTREMLDHENVEIRVAGFSTAQEVNKRSPDEVQVMQLRAPEVILGYPWSTPVDVWMIGCLTFEYLTGASLFPIVFGGDEEKATSVHLQRMVEITGEKFEAKFLNQCSKHSKFFDAKTYELLHTEKGEAWSLEGHLQQHKVNERDIPSAAAFIRKCLILDPTKRLSAEQLLRESWLA